jgi:phage shock protein PspC (stress-responsive transcriptional regulator)
MKKVINITLGSIVFAIEENAHSTLERYLDDIKTQLLKTDDSAEILKDIEGALAEKFIALDRSERKAIINTNVETVRAEMGSPSEFGDYDGESPDDQEDTSGKSSEQKKRLYRDGEDVVIAGVSSGLARYFGTDPVIIRIMFIVSIFFSGVGILVYIILWLVVPLAKTTSDKYAMRGQDVTLQHITESVKKNLKKIDSDNIIKAKGFWKKIRDVLAKIFSMAGSVIPYLVKALRYIVGAVLTIAGGFGIIGVISAYTVVLFSNKVFLPEEAQVVFDTVLGSPLGITAVSALFVVIIILLVVFITGGVSLLIKRNCFTANKVVVLAIVWVFAVIVTVSTGTLQVERVADELDLIDHVRIEINTESIVDDTDI